MRSLVRAGLGAAFLFFAIQSSAGEDRLEMTVDPRRAFEPATLVMKVALEPHEENRYLEVEADSMTYYRKSEVALDADRSPRRFEFVFPGVPAGNYAVRALLLDVSGDVIVRVMREVVVID